MRTVNTRCPVEPEHGHVIPVKEATSRYGWYCPHAAHDGRLESHPAGAAPRTRAHFTTAEVERGSLVEGIDEAQAAADAVRLRGPGPLSEVREAAAAR